MQPTPYDNVNILLGELLKNIQKILAENLLGLYLNGSLVLGDFDLNISDIDLVAILTKDINDKEFKALKEMHEEFVEKHKDWNDRIEVCYISLTAINLTMVRESNIVNISPGEQFHRTKSRKEWLMNWYLTREKSMVLYGPSPKTIIDQISKEEFIQSVKDHVTSWGKWVQDMKNPYAQSYAILSLCRALYAYRKGDQVSKKQAAIWAQGELPEWSEVIKDALKWREGGKYKPADETTHFKTVQFVNYVRKLILAE